LSANNSASKMYKKNVNVTFSKSMNINNKKLKEFCELYIFREREEFQSDTVLLNVLDEGNMKVKIILSNMIFSSADG
jgi:hypothetical protein